ncbi:probable RNA helicase SDE3 [Aristolochia californica]|uniref:probable RNA helicase SDE3 n=1 Tax=Aristolochia californica TaxID=171875 RepID=UPI0035DF4AEB
MSTLDSEGWGDDNYSVIGEEHKIGFLDYHNENSFENFDLNDEGPVIISSPFPLTNGNPQSSPIGSITSDSITLRNTTSEPIELWGVQIYSSNPEGSYTLSLMKPPTDESDEEALSCYLESTSLEDRVLQPNTTLTIWLSCKLQVIGLHCSIVHFDVGNDKIERVGFLLGEDRISQSLVSNRPYSRRPRKKGPSYDQYKEGYVKGPRVAKENRHFKYSLPRFAIPDEVKELIHRKEVPEVLLGGLNEDNYVDFFKNLLYMEEIHLEEEMRQYDMECVTMRRKGRYLALVVPGLAEKRPSLVTGDDIFVKFSKEDHSDATRYQGWIHRVEADEVFLKFADEFQQSHHDNELYDVTFKFNRVNLRRCYQAVETAKAELPFEFLLPLDPRLIDVTPVVPLNCSLNGEQLSSVEKILACKGAPPYVIHGPPGTGKTVTLLEAILQLYKIKKGRKGAQILVCAASNSAADHILERLINNKMTNVKKSEIFRLNAPSRGYEDIQPEILQFCFFDDMVFKSPPLGALLSYKIIISTYSSASLLYAEGVPRGHFSHLFLDEAGQASEPEIMISIANFCQRTTVVILAGDPMQLGPVVLSKEAENFGLGKSYLERLFECEPYFNGDDNFVTKLVRNYRSHPAILRLPSELFYKGELMACREQKDASLNDWSDLPCKDFPVLYLGLQGCDEREGSNPSWFNRFEASKVVEIIRRLCVSTDVTEEDIGVITPYRQQVVKIKGALEAIDMEGVKVGSVEQFQGQERRVIIISTVRSTVKHNEFDSRHNLGFLTNPKRLNVSVTRAKSLLVIVGNPYIITKDPYWDKLLRYCSDNNSYQGCLLPPPENHELCNAGPASQPQLNEYELTKQSSVGEREQSSVGERDRDSSEVENVSKPVPDAVDWDEDSWRDEDTLHPTSENKYHGKGETSDSSTKAKNPPPCFDESQWSDGWTS